MLQILRLLCWLEHMSLDNETGLDPPGIKVRPVSGLAAADYFAIGYSLWAVIIENLTRIGYEGKSMHMAAYDWRLSFQNTEGASKSRKPVQHNVSCGDVWTEYHEMNWESVQAVAEHKVYTAETILDLLRFVAPKMMKRGDAHFSYDIADNLNDSKYGHYKYWSNPLETTLPDAPDMEVCCLYGVGIPTERSYVYRMSPSADMCYIPFQIDISADGDSEGCLKGGVNYVNGDETVPAMSAGFMCAQGWQQKSRFNPSCMAIFTREYIHAPPNNVWEGRGMQSGAHFDIMGNVALIEDIMRIATGATGKDIGGDRIYSDILKWAEQVNLKL